MYVNLFYLIVHMCNVRLCLMHLNIISSSISINETNIDFIFAISILVSIVSPSDVDPIRYFLGESIAWFSRDRVYENHAGKLFKLFWFLLVLE